MFAILHALGIFVADLFESRCRLSSLIVGESPGPVKKLRPSDRSVPLVLYIVRGANPGVVS
jgi:hypothetical protein